MGGCEATGLTTDSLYSLFCAKKIFISKIFFLTLQAVMYEWGVVTGYRLQVTGYWLATLCGCGSLCRRHGNLRTPMVMQASRLRSQS